MSVPAADFSVTDVQKPPWNSAPLPLWKNGSTPLLKGDRIGGCAGDAMGAAVEMLFLDIGSAFGERSGADEQAVVRGVGPGSLFALFVGVFDWPADGVEACGGGGGEV